MTVRRFRIVALYATFVSLAAAFGAAMPPAGVSWHVTLLAIVVVALGGVLVIEYFVNGSGRPIPFMPGVGIFYAIVFGITMFSSSVVEYADPLWNEQTQLKVLSLVAGGLGMLVGTFYFSRDLIFQKVRTIRLPNGASDLLRFRFVGWLLVIAYVLAVTFDWNRNVPTVGNYFSNTGGFVGIGIMFFLWKRHKLSIFEKTIIVVLIGPAVLIAAFTSGLLSAVLFLAVFVGLLAFRLTRRIPWTLVIVASGFLLVFTPIKNEYRIATLYVQHQQVGPLEKAELFSGLALDYLGDNSTSDLLGSSWDKIAVRLCNLLVFAQVVGSTPSVVPFWEGETYLHLLYKPIPRIFWDGKPTETVGNEFGKRYGIVASGDDDTSVNLPWIVEMYANFGGWFVLVGMAFVGFFFGWLDRKFNGSSMNDVEFVLALALLVPLIYQESNFSVAIGGFLFSGAVTFVWLSVVSRIGRFSNLRQVGN